MAKNILVLVASVFCGLLIIEIALRILGWTSPVFAQPDSTLGWSFRPSISGWSIHENSAYLSINRFGFRGSDWPKEPAPGKFRVAVIGDSMVESSNLPDDHALPNVIEKYLTTCSALGTGRAEVLNLGVSGYGSAQEYLLLQRAVEDFHPHLSLLVFYVGNDVADNTRSLSLEVQQARPYFVELPSGRLQLDTSFRESDGFRKALSSHWLARLVNRFYLLQAVKQVRLGKSIAPWPKSLQVAYDQGEHENIRFGPQYPQLFSPPADDVWSSAWSISEKLLVKMRDWTVSRGSEFALVILPEPIQALPSPGWRHAVAQKFELPNMDYPIERIARVAALNAIPFLNLLGPLRDFADSQSVFLYGFPPQLGEGHLNATGTEVSGRAIASWLCERAAQKP
jgi:lysophospholipase L1-like esterase